MSVTPLSPQQILQGRLEAYVAAELRILRSQETRIGDGVTLRLHRNPDLEAVRQEIQKITAQLAAYGPRRVTYLR